MMNPDLLESLLAEADFIYHLRRGEQAARS